MATIRFNAPALCVQDNTESLREKVKQINDNKHWTNLDRVYISADVPYKDSPDK